MHMHVILHLGSTVCTYVLHTHTYSVHNNVLHTLSVPELKYPTASQVAITKLVIVKFREEGKALCVSLVALASSAESLVLR